MNTEDKQSSTGKIGRGLSPVALGRYTKDYHRMTAQIAYHCEIRDSSNNQEVKATQQRIIDSCTKRLAELEEKLKHIPILKVGVEE